MNFRQSSFPIMAVAVLSVQLISCVSNQAAKIPDNAKVSITLERTICYGKCPAYKLTIDSSGSVTYVGDQFVKIVGTQTATISKAKFGALISAFDEAEFLLLNDKYTSYEITDQPSAITSITVDGKTKQVTHYHGDNNASKSLMILEGKIDEIVDVKKWTGN